MESTSIIGRIRKIFTKLWHGKTEEALELGQDACNSINDLPDLALLKIFEFLHYEDRLNARLSCLRWKNLMEAPFYNQLNLENCVISSKCPPYTVFMDSSRKFSLLIISDGLKYAVKQEWIEFMKFVGKNVRTIEFLVGIDNRIIWESNWLHSFEMLRHIILTNVRDIEILDLPKSIQSITINDPVAFLDASDLNLVQAIKSIQNTNMNDPCRIMIENLLVTDSFFNNIFSENTLRFLEDLNTISYCNIGTNNSIRKFESLPLDFVTSVPSVGESDMVKLSSMPNLKDVTLEINDGGCLFIHEPIEFKSSLNIATLVIIFPSAGTFIYCSRCIKNVIRSLTYISRLKLCMNSNCLFNCRDLQNFMDYFPSNIVSLELHLGYQIEPEITYLTLNFSKLRSIIITSLQIFHFEILFPKKNLLNLSVHCYYQGISSPIGATIVDKMKFQKIVYLSLTTLKISSLSEIEEKYGNSLMYLELYTTESFTLRDFIANLSPFCKFKKLCKIDTSYQRGTVKQIMKIYKLIPTLRQFGDINYGDVCLKEYDIQL